MIEYVHRSAPPEAMVFPLFICDACRKQVQGSGNILRMDSLEGDRRTTPLFVAHKGTCDLQVEDWLKAAYPESDGWGSVVLWEELKTFALQIENNARHPINEGPEFDYHWPRLVFPDPAGEEV